jgi:hypothetical protein
MRLDRSADQRGLTWMLHSQLQIRSIRKKNRENVVFRHQHLYVRWGPSHRRDWLDRNRDSPLRPYAACRRAPRHPPGIDDELLSSRWTCDAVCVEAEKRVQRAEAARASEAEKWRHLTVSTVFDDGRFESRSYMVNSARFLSC